MLQLYSTLIMHADFDAFFASVEQALDPNLAGRPVIVGGRETDRSVVASASYEARALGVKTAMPLSQAKRLCPRAVFLRGSHKRYTAASQAAFSVFDRYTPTVQSASLDEGYLDFTHCARLYAWEQKCLEHAVDWQTVAEQIKNEVKQQTGVNVSIGIGSNKLVAKIATTLAKPNGIVQVWPGYEAAFVAPLPVGAIPGIGSRTAEILGTFNVKTVDQLTRLSRDLLVRTFGTYGRVLYSAARGIGSVVLPPPERPKSISRETTFEADTDDPTTIEGMLYYLLERAAHQMRSIGLRARSVSVRVRYSDFQTLAKSKRLDQPTHLDVELYRTVLHLLERVHIRRMRLRLVGVTLSQLSEARSYQEDLFNPSDYAAHRDLLESVDRIRNRYGFGSVIAGRALNLMKDHARDSGGFQLRTPALTR